MVRSEERIDGMIERTIGEEAYEQSILLTRRGFLKIAGFVALSIGTGIGFAGCSSKGPGENIEFKPPLQSGYKLLVFPKNAPEVTDDVIKHIEEIGGGRGFEAYPPYGLTCLIKDNGKWKWILSTQITPNERIYNFRSNDIPGFVIGDEDTYFNPKTGAFIPKLQYCEELPKFIDFANKNINPYNAFVIRGVASDNKAYMFMALAGRKGGNVAAIAIVQNPQNPKEYKLYVFKHKEKLDKMMQTIFLSVSVTNWVIESTSKMLREYAKDSKWRFFPEDYYRRKGLYP